MAGDFDWVDCGGGGEASESEADEEGDRDLLGGSVVGGGGVDLDLEGLALLVDWDLDLA